MPQQFKQNLELHHKQAKKAFKKNHPHADQWLKSKNLQIGKVRAHSQKLLTGAGLSATLMLSAPASPQVLPPPTAKIRLAQAGMTPASQFTSLLHQKINPIIPKRIGHLDADIETKVSSHIKDSLGIKASSTFEGQRLNHSLGWIGYEQHLRRYPGDSISQHDAELRSGMAPGNGAWGHFASSKTAMTNQDFMREKYYLAVQTLYLPTWEKDLKFLREWYKYRKMLVVNVENGTAVVAVIGDAGPAAWTGKQFGGSPEVMRSLDLTGKKSKGKVLIYFIDDPDNKIPLGPVKGKIGEGVKLT